MTKSPFYKRPLFVLLVTLLIGALIGASITGMIVRNRLENARQFAHADGYTRLVESIVEPTSAEQGEAIRPIVSRAGEDIEQIVGDSRTEINQRFEQMERELEPHLTEAQRDKLRDRHALVRGRYSDTN